MTEAELAELLNRFVDGEQKYQAIIQSLDGHGKYSTPEKIQEQLRDKEPRDPYGIIPVFYTVRNDDNNDGIGIYVELFEVKK